MTTQKTTLLTHVPARATVTNIKTILTTMEVLDRRADKAHSRGDFSKATAYSEFVRQLDELVALYRGELPL